MTKAALLTFALLLSACTASTTDTTPSSERAIVPSDTEGSESIDQSAPASPANGTTTTAGQAAPEPKPAGCSADGSDQIIIGVWAHFYGGGYAAVVLAEDCTACRSVDLSGVTTRTLSSKGRTWSSHYDGDQKHVRITYALADGSTYDGDVVDLEKRTLSLGGLSDIEHGDGRELTCDGVTAKSRPIP